MHTDRSRRPRPTAPRPVTKRIPQPRAELPPSIREEEARLLAVMLRTSRLTWVFAEPGTDKSRLLTAGVLPLLQRRAMDGRLQAVETISAEAAAPARRRRASDGAASPKREIAVYFDDWSDEPLTDLKRRLADLLPPQARAPLLDEGRRLAKMLQHLSEHFGVHLILLFDRFEEYLSRPADQDEYARFSSELIEAFTLASLPASFLISLDEQARPMLDRLRSRVPGLDHSFLRLTPVAERRDVGPAPPVRPGMSAAEASAKRSSLGRASGRRKSGPPPRVAIKVEDVYALIEATLVRTAAPPQPRPLLGRTMGEGAPRGAPSMEKDEDSGS